MKYKIRAGAEGNNAGSLKEGMNHSYISLCDCITIFEADFHPKPDFLCCTIPFLIQARWKFDVMSLLRAKVTLIGLLEDGRVNEWVVTKKLGDASKTKRIPSSGSGSGRVPGYQQKLEKGSRHVDRAIPLFINESGIELAKLFLSAEQPARDADIRGWRKEGRVATTTSIMKDVEVLQGAKDKISSNIGLKLYMMLVFVLVKLFGQKAEKRFKWEPMKDDVEAGNTSYPVVLVQVYQLSIGAACRLSWPANRIIIQVLDDSTDATIAEVVKIECKRWAAKGVNVKYEIRQNRKGYKAGALKEGMKHSYVSLCDYVAIFDADFQPDPDFLQRTIPFLVHNPELALVQARWKFVNAGECMLTRLQQIFLDFHFTIEQELGSAVHDFFGFNVTGYAGTAGVWRISALNDAGGWKDRTTVEDMDLAIRASLKGWKFVYLNDLKVKSELPSTFQAYRYQQHRWSAGPANLFRKMIPEVIKTKKVTFWKKVHILYSFFFVRKIIGHIVSFFFYCVVLPATVFFPEVVVPKWAAVYIPSIITCLHAFSTPRSIHLLPFWLLFENVMSLHRTKGTLIGLFEAGRVNEWVVTEKLGDALKTKSASKPRKLRFRTWHRLHLLELLTGAYLFCCVYYDFVHGRRRYFLYLTIQSIAFFMAGVGYVGTFVPKT
ncbi:hypothetical protein MLD38_038055 [Melastoma candidum]|uniref:Uncharacterized protein n=1 Tax=Melastoma candidum TaxID=119954 RepID=A0ACB9KY05_9MYRT|nr:hypothetical protein MLD38_038055 [Melastoma candidum]